jgi:hypothetical protein
MASDRRLEGGSVLTFVSSFICPAEGDPGSVVDVGPDELPADPAHAATVNGPQSRGRRQRQAEYSLQHENHDHDEPHLHRCRRCHHHLLGTVLNLAVNLDRKCR